MFLIYTKNKNKVLLFGYSEYKHYRHREINTNCMLKKKKLKAHQGTGLLICAFSTTLMI